MNEIISKGLTILITMAIILVCAVIAWIIYGIIWKMWFIPIDKQIKVDKERAAINREFTKIEDKQARLIDEIEILRAEYSNSAVKNNDLEVDIKRKQQLLKEYTEEIKDFRAWKEQGAPKVIQDPEELKKKQELDALDAKIAEAENTVKNTPRARKIKTDNI